MALQPVLSWAAGRAAYQHDIYLGTDLTAVLNATPASPEYMGRRSITNFTPLTTLSAATNYYWRVDEVEGGATVAKGNLGLLHRHR